MELGQRRDQSSGSDEESNVRHDRFKSERFQSNTSNTKTSEERQRDIDRHSNHRTRERSPRSHRHRERPSPSNYRSESRSSNDKKDRERKHKSRQRSERSDQSNFDRRRRDEKIEDISTTNGVTNKKSLSHLLKNFDKQVESKCTRLDGSDQSQTIIGPALPASLSKKNEDEEKESNRIFDLELDDMVGPALPSPLKNVSKHSSSDSDSNYSDKDSGDFGASINIESETAKNNSVDGPMLPPHLQNLQPKTEIHSDDQESLESSKRNNESGPCTNLNYDSRNLQAESEVFGPALPPKPQADLYGPALPPKKESDSFGPTLPPKLKESVIQGPALPPEGVLPIQEEESDDEDVVGPLPEGKMNVTQYQLDLRALEIKRKLEEEKNQSSTDVKKREEWMLELPPEKATNLGLGPRTFRMREGPDMSNRSEWTDTPADKLRKLEQAQKGEASPVDNEELMKTAFVRERNKEMEKMAKKSKKDDSALSLLELHQKKLKKKKKKEEKEGKKKERRPFDRNIDLQVHRFDEAQKKAIFKKAQLLNTRFSSGESKYL